MKRLSLKYRLAALAVLLIAATGGFFALKNAYSGQPHDWVAPSGPVTWLGHEFSYDNGKISVRVGSAQPNGNRIGDIVPVRVVIVTDPSVQLDLSGLEGGTLSATNGSSSYSYSDGYAPPYGYGGGYPDPTANSNDTTPDFTEAAPPVVHDFWSHGKHVYVLDIAAQTAFKVKNQLAFVIDFSYADGYSNGQPNWTQMTTDQVFIGTTRSSAPKDQFDPGDYSQRTTATPPVAYPLAGFGYAVLVLLIGWVIFTWPLRLRFFRSASPSEKAWKVFDAAFKDGERKGWTEAHFNDIAAALRQFLGLEVLTVSQMNKLTDLPMKPMVLTAFRLLDRAMYAHEQLKPSDIEVLRGCLLQLVPKEQQHQ